MGEIINFLLNPGRALDAAMTGTSDLNPEYGDVVPLPTELMPGAGRTPEAEALIQKTVGHTVIGPSSI